ncbi:MAG: PA14 domain-containing protein [Tepidisphaeraceae bacterium]
MTEPMHLVVTLNDAIAGPFEVEVVDRPILRSAAFTVVLPAYTRLGQVVKQPSDLTLLAGSRIGAAGNASKPVGHQGCFLEFTTKSGDVRVPLARDAADPFKLALANNVAVPADATGVSIHLVDENGFESQGDATYPISIRPDTAPTITIARPSRKQFMLTAWAKLPIEFEAADDIGLDGIRLSYFVRKQSGMEIRGGTGLAQTVYATPDFNGKSDVSIAPKVDVDWGDGPAVQGFPRDNFSVRWTGVLLVPQSGSYRFRSEADDRLRLTLGDRVLLDSFIADDKRDEDSKSTVLEAGPIPVKIEFREIAGQARVRLLWRNDDTHGWEPVPAKYLYPDDASYTAAEGAARQTVSIWTTPAEPTRRASLRYTWDIEFDQRRTRRHRRVATGGRGREQRDWPRCRPQ